MSVKIMMSHQSLPFDKLNDHLSIVSILCSLKMKNHPSSIGEAFKIRHLKYLQDRSNDNF